MVDIKMGGEIPSSCADQMVDGFGIEKVYNDVQVLT